MLSDPNAVEEELNSYVSLYLEEEVRKEALVRNLTAFSQLLRLSCIESGRIANFSKISQDIGLSHNTVSEYYRILQDCLIVRRIEALTQTPSRRTLSKSPKFILFDLGGRRAGTQEGLSPSREHMGHLLEQFVGLDLLNQIECFFRRASLYYWRDHNGPEVDYVIEYNNTYISIEVKFTSKPSEKDIKHLKVFKEEYATVGNGYVIADIPFPLELESRIITLPWHQLYRIFEDKIFQDCQDGSHECW